MCGDGRSPQKVLEEASDMLSGSSSCAGLVMAPTQEESLRHIEFVSLAPGRALVVLVSESGMVENRVIDVPLDMPTSKMVEASNFLSSKLVGRSLAEARREIDGEIAEHRATLDLLTQKVVEAGLATWSEGGNDGGVLIVRGQAKLLDDVTALGDLERIRGLFQALETRIVVAAFGSNGSRRRGSDFHWCGERFVCAFRMFDDYRALPKPSGTNCRCHWRDRPDAHELCTNNSNGRLYGQACRASARLERKRRDDRYE